MYQDQQRAYNQHISEMRI